MPSSLFAHPSTAPRFVWGWGSVLVPMAVRNEGLRPFSRAPKFALFNCCSACLLLGPFVAQQAKRTISEKVLRRKNMPHRFCRTGKFWYRPKV